MCKTYDFVLTLISRLLCLTVLVILAVVLVELNQLMGHATLSFSLPGTLRQQSSNVP